MREGRFTEAQTNECLEENAVGLSASDLCRKADGMSGAIDLTSSRMIRVNDSTVGDTWSHGPR